MSIEQSFPAFALGIVTPVSQKRLVLTSRVGESGAIAERSNKGGDLRRDRRERSKAPF